MPFESQAQWKWAFANNQDFARSWAKETPGGKRKFAQLAKKVGFKAAVDQYTTSMKAREYVRDDFGRFAEKPGGGSDKVQRTIENVNRASGGGSGRAKRAPRKTQAQRAAERATERRDNAMTVLDKVGFDASDYELLDTDAAQDPNDESVKRLLNKGLMEQVGDKVYVSPLGKSVMSAAASGDADKAQQAIDRASARQAERYKRQAERDARKAERDAKKAEREAKKKRGGGGGGGKKPATSAQAAKPDKVAKARAAKVKKLDSQIARLSQRLEGESDGAKAQAYKKQIDALTSARDKLTTTKSYKAIDGHKPPQGVREAAKRGLELRSQFNRGGTAVGIARARDLSNGKNVTDSTIKRMNSFFARHAVDRRPGWGDPSNPTNGYIAHLLWGGDAGKAWARKVSRQIESATMKASEPTNPDLWKRAIAAAKRRYSVYPSRYANYFASAWYRARGGKWKTQKSMTGSTIIYKSIDGKYRWVGISANAFRDREREIISTKALRDAVERSAKTGDFGPLRYWHVPGLEIGTTDFQALTDNGRFLIESGIIHDPTIAEALMQKGKGWEMSIGFVHSKQEPDADKVYHNIQIFERSITPPGYAANGLTSIEVGE